MKITSITTRVCNAEMRNWVFVRVETDEPGLFGWGEATLEWKTRAVVGAVDDLAPLLVGQDPRDIEQCQQILTKHGFWRMGVDRHVGDQRHRDRALGHSRQVARRAGLAPARRQGARLPPHLHPSRPRRHEGGLRIRHHRRASSSAAAIVTQAGYDAVKVVCIPYTHYLAGNRDVDKVGAHALRPARGARSRHRHHGRLPRPPGLGHRRARLHPRPSRRAGRSSSRSRCRPRISPASPQVTARSEVPIASGERLVGRREFEPAIRGAESFTSPSPTSATPAACSRRRRSPPWPRPPASASRRTIRSGPIAGVAALHFGISTPNVIIQEEMSGAVPWYDEVVDMADRPQARPLGRAGKARPRRRGR